MWVSTAKTATDTSPDSIFVDMRFFFVIRHRTYFLVSIRFGCDVRRRIRRVVTDLVRSSAGA